MSLLVTFNGANYIIPQTNEVGWGSNLDAYFVAIAAGCLQKTGGNFTLSVETDFGSSFGLKSLYYKSRGSNIASTGVLRLNNNSDSISWRNALNNGDLALTVNASNQLSFNGVPLESSSLTNNHILVGNVSNIATDVAMSGDVFITNTGLTTIQPATITGSKIANLTITDSNISSTAAIAYSKLALSNSIVNADINTAAAIALSKLAALSTLKAVATDASGIITTSTTTFTELGFVSGVTSSIQTQLNAKATGSIASGSANQLTYYTGSTSLAALTAITASKALVSDTNGLPVASVTTTSELAFVSGVTSAIQTQLNAKATDSLVVHLAGTETITGSKTFSAALLTSNGSVSLPGIAPSADTATGFQFLNSNHSIDIVSNGVSLATFANDVTRTAQIRGASGIAVQLGTAISLVGSDVTLTTSSKGLILTDNTTNTVKLKATNSTTSWTMSLPTTAGTSGFALTTDGSGNTTWTSAGSGTVGSGTAGRLSLYNSSTNAVTDTYVQNANNINIAIASHATLAATRTYTIPDAGASASFMMTEGAQTVNGSQTLTSALTITPTTNQLILGTTRTATITAPTPATASRTYTFPDLSGNYNVVGDSGTQTIGGAKTFSTGVTITNFVVGNSLNAFLYGTMNSTGSVGIDIFNTNTTNANAHAALVLETPNATTSGDPFIEFICYPSIGTSFPWSIGADKSVNGNFVISQSTSLGSSNAISISPTSLAVAIHGTNTNDTPNSGFVGEVVSSAVGSTNFPSSNTYGDLTSIILSAGDWLISGFAEYDRGTATVTDSSFGITTHTGNSSTGFISGDTSMNIGPWPSTGHSEYPCIPYIHAQLSGTTTYYLKYYAVYTGGPPTAEGRITAVRIR